MSMLHGYLSRTRVCKRVCTRVCDTRALDVLANPKPVHTRALDVLANPKPRH